MGVKTVPRACPTSNSKSCSPGMSSVCWKSLSSLFGECAAGDVVIRGMCQGLDRKVRPLSTRFSAIAQHMAALLRQHPRVLLTCQLCADGRLWLLPLQSVQEAASSRQKLPFPPVQAFAQLRHADSHDGKNAVV